MIDASYVTAEVGQDSKACWSRVHKSGTSASSVFLTPTCEAAATQAAMSCMPNVTLGGIFI